MSEKIPDGYDASAWFDDDAGVSISALVDLKATARSEGYRAGLEAAAKAEAVLKGYGDGYETSAKRVPYARGWDAGQKALREAIRALMGKEGE
jgi:hypothetical protein